MVGCRQVAQSLALLVLALTTCGPGDYAYVRGDGMDFWVHDLDPFIFQIGGWGPRWYGLAYLVGILWGYWLIKRWSQQGRSPLYPDEVQDFVTWAGIGMVAGGRLGFCLFYDPQLFVDFRGSVPFWGVLAVHEGGMASHGGAIGMAIAVWLWGWRRGRSIPALADALATVIPIGVIFGRLANFWNGELWGRVSTVPWAVIFPDSVHYQEPRVMVPSDLERGSAEWIAWMQANVQPRHPSQLYAMFLEGVVVLLISLYVHKRHRRPGLSVGVMVLSYGIVRFISEIWRQPDFGYELYFGWLSKGQALSMPMWLIGFGLIWYARSRPPRPEAYLDPGKRPD